MGRVIRASSEDGAILVVLVHRLRRARRVQQEGSGTLHLLFGCFVDWLTHQPVEPAQAARPG